MKFIHDFIEIDYMSQTTIDFTNTFGSNFCLGSVTNIDLDNKSVSVQRQNKEEQMVIEYTDLVIAVGSKGPFPSRIFSQKAEDAAKEYKELGIEVKREIFDILVVPSSNYSDDVLFN